ncbi:hypothetical protein F889_00473 [Acinetobacter colistiniresistens]|uniref:HTH cro/C1-type domain-containing protein n=1 Tax=Acinetobacter colistiniresistens TaxID=280145 RepID=N9R1U1_9GAMM|nr:helix-turn-helix transcriptional regulator [Acinetobacter colistiniresistens]ENX36311.1 hypothetical protein F889_00473 [Acinetobacter colistiniresistens]
MNLQEKISFLITSGYTQQYIGEKSGIGQSSVSRILRGLQQSVNYERGVALDKLVEIAQVQQCPKH